MVKRTPKKPARVPAKTAATGPTRAAAEPRLLAGGNPQIAKGEGDGPVRAYVAAMPGWKRRVGRRLDGIICTGEAYKSAVKLTFAKGAFIEDPSGLFNSSLEGDTRRAIDIREGDKVNERAFKALIRDAAVMNASKP